MKKKFKNTFAFSNNGINKFILLLRKGVYSYEYMNDEKFNETTLPEKIEFCNNLKKILRMQITCMQKEFVKTLKQKI